MACADRPSAEAPWWKGAVIYQIYPRSFMDASGDGVGDLDGVIRRLNYVAGLGVDAIWLSPFFPSPMKDFGYDVADYRAVDPVFGDLAAFDRLLAEAHSRGLRVLIDQVWSHTSDQHAWFKESAESRDNPKADWYVWADARKDGTPPNNWLAVFGGPSWSWSARRRQYYLHNFLAEQPDLNFWTGAVQDAILDVARFWLDRGVDGFRLDTANFYVHDRLLRDNPPAELARTPPRPDLLQRHTRDRYQPETLAFMERLRGVMDGYAGGRMAVGEIGGEDALATQRAYTAPGRLHTAYSFFLLDAEAATPALFRAAMDAWSDAPGWPAWSLSNHDVPRYPTRLAGPDGPDLTRTKTLMALLLCLRGQPYLYQGDELGLPQAHVPFERLQDPFAKMLWVGGEGTAGSGRDGARTPMPWSADAPNAGFTTAAEAWLPVDPRHAALAADRQETDDVSMLAFTRRVLALRRGSPALRTGGFTPLQAQDGVLAFEREADGERVLCVFELGGRPARFTDPRVASSRVALSLQAALETGALDLEPFGMAVVTL